MKYILKKEYPGSPKIDSVIEIKNNGGYELENSTSYFMTKDKVENYPEFWQPVIEKDYEILSFTDLFSKNIMKKHQNNNFGIVWGEYTEKDQLDKLSQGKKIHSVKRLSDSQIFTIGDIINTRVDDKYKQEILEINLGINYNFLKDKLIFKTKAGYVIIDIAVKTKEKLFTTEDGVDIFEGDSFIRVYTKDFTLFDKKLTEPVSKNYDIKENWDKRGIIHFSTKEKAEEYILLNKPCLSYGEVQEYLKVKDCNKVLDLAQSKIQQSV